jgi:hypothetical protein
MDAKHLAIVFAPNIVDRDPIITSQMSETAKEFLMGLIADWDVSGISPIPQGMLQEAPRLGCDSAASEGGC